jgi:hypothetical protein
MRLEYRADGRWAPLQGSSLISFMRATGAQVGPGLPQVEWLSLPFYEFTALVRLPDAVGGASEWYLTNGGRFWPIDKFGAAIGAMNETAPLRLTSNNVASYFRFWCAFTIGTGRTIVLDVHDPELAAEAADESDPLLRGVVVEGQSPQGYLLSATVLMDGEIQRRYFRVTSKGAVEALDHVSLSLQDVMPLRKAS